MKNLLGEFKEEDEEASGDEATTEAAGCEGDAAQLENIETKYHMDDFDDEDGGDLCKQRLFQLNFVLSLKCVFYILL